MKNIKDFKNFLLKEKKYFEPILRRQKKATIEEKENWRNETIMQRKKRISSEIFNMYEGEVQHGPFKGMKLSDENWWGDFDLSSMILGTYEQDILKFIFSMKCQNFSNFINIGAGDGFYSCGLLFSKRMHYCLAYEENVRGRKTIKINAKNNNVENKIKINGKASSKILCKLKNINFNKTLLLIDIEGEEFDLLDENFLRFFSKSLLIVEIHNWVYDFWRKYENLLKLANNFFDIGFIKTKKKNLYNSFELREFTDDNRLLMISESRPCLMKFLVLSPKH